MARKTIAELEAELAKAEERIHDLESGKAAVTVTALPEDTVSKVEFESLKAQHKVELDEVKAISKVEVEVKEEEFQKLQKQFENLSQEHDDLVSKYEASPELADKVRKAVETLSDKPKALLFKKVSLALGEVRRIPKNGWNSFFKYKYSQEGDILDGIRPILSEVGLMIWTTIKHDERKVVTYFSKGNEQGAKTITKVEIEFMIGCADTGETLTSIYKGEGEDEGDKGLYKAYTGATKYFLTKNFLISSGDVLNDVEPNDPEADTSRAHEQQRQTNGNGSNSRQNKNQTQRQGQRPEAQEQLQKQLEAEKAEAREVWLLLAGSDEGFEGFYNKQRNVKNVSHVNILNYLNESLAKKQAEAKAAAQNGQADNNDAPPPNMINMNEEDRKAPEQKADTAKTPEEMTPEEYLEFVENSIPFPLTPTEREQILQDARDGKRNHGR